MTIERLTKEQHEAKCIRLFGMSEDEFHKHWVILSCNCEHSDEVHWSNVKNSPEAIAEHNRVYGPGGQLDKQRQT